MAIEARHVLGFALTAGMLGCGGSNATAPAPLPRAHLDLGRVRIPNATDIGEARTLVGVAASMGRETRSVQDPITVTSLTGTWVGQPAFVTEPVVLELVQEDATLTGTARWQGKASRLSGTVSYHRENGPTPSPGMYWRQPFHLDFVVEPFPRTSGGAPAGRYLEQTDRPFEILWPVVSWATSVRLDRQPVP